MLAAIAVTLLAEWIAAVIGANQSQWDVLTWLQVGLLVVMTGVTGKARIDLRRAADGGIESCLARGHDGHRPMVSARTHGGSATRSIAL